VFVEKPLALTYEELKEVEAAYAASEGSALMVGFNRRFAPHVQEAKRLLETVTEPKVFVMVMNAGAIPAEHWTQDRIVGGGRIVGEACHYIDLMRYLAGADIVSVQARRMGDTTSPSVTEDKAAITLGFADGSFGTLHYLANGATRFPKERIEIFTSGRVLQLVNFRKMIGYGWKGFKSMNLWSQDKGQRACAAAFLEFIEKGGASPIPPEQIFEVARVTLEAVDELRNQ
jgi:predicted dehydrogenase